MASSRQIADNSVQYVQIDGLVVLKIIKHCQEEGAGGTDLVQGVLLGLVEDNRLEVTNCFPFPRHTEEEQFDEVKYQMEMMRNLRQVNIDHLHVGWYQSTYFGTYLNKALLDSQFNYQHSIEESVVLIYDPLRTTKGHLTLKALRLTPKMMEMYSEGDFTPDKVKERGISFEDMFEEIPVVVKNSHLMNALLCETSEKMPEDTKHQFLDLATSSILEKNLQLQMDCVDDLAQEANRFFNYQRQMARYNQLKSQNQQKHEAENKARVQRGEPPLPDEDYSRTLKLPPQPSRLDSLLIAGQVCSYAEQTSQFATQSFGKLFVADSLQGVKDKHIAN